MKIKKMGPCTSFQSDSYNYSNNASFSDKSQFDVPKNNILR